MFHQIQEYKLNPLIWNIPIVKPVQFDNMTINLPIDPYLLGVYFGCQELYEKNNYYDLINNSKRISYISKKYNKVPNDFFQDKFNEWICPSIDQKELLDNIKNNLQLSNMYIQSTIENRLSFLQGLFDTIGQYDNNNLIIVNCCSNKIPIQSIIEIVQSLGGLMCYNSEKLQYTVSLPKSLIPFTMLDLVKNYELNEKKNPIRQIKSIQPVRFTDVICISVDAFDHLYVTEHFIVTHNTIQVYSIIFFFLSYHQNYFIKFS